MKKLTEDMRLSKGSKITIEIQDEISYGIAKLLVLELRHQLRQKPYNVKVSIEAESPDYDGPEKIFTD